MLGYGTCRNPECVSDIYAPGKNRSIPGSVCADVSTWKRLRGRIVFLEKMVDKSIQRKDEMAAKSPDRLVCAPSSRQLKKYKVLCCPVYAGQHFYAANNCFS